MILFTELLRASSIVVLPVLAGLTFLYARKTGSNKMLIVVLAFLLSVLAGALCCVQYNIYGDMLLCPAGQRVLEIPPTFLVRYDQRLCIDDTTLASLTQAIAHTRWLVQPYLLVITLLSSLGSIVIGSTVMLNLRKGRG